MSKLPDGRWAASALVQKPDGSYVRVKREAKSRAVAMARLEDAKRLAVAGCLGVGKIPTVGEHMDAWHRDTFTPHGRPTSIKTYRVVIDRLIAPGLGEVRIDKLNAPRLRQWIADLTKQGLAPKSISMARSLLRQALDQAVDDGLILANPVTRTIKAPPARASIGKALTPEQARDLLDAAKGERLEAAIRLALCLGLRRGEVCGLRWEDVDMVGATLTVNGQITYSPDTGIQRTEPKTVNAARSIRMPAVLLGVLRWHQNRQIAEHRAMGWADPVYVFSRTSTGDALPPIAFYHTFKRIAATAGLSDFRLHDLRHSAASFLLAEGVSLKRVQQILGHARGSTTLNIYGHLLPGEDDDATERVQRRIDGKNTHPTMPEDGAAMG